MTSKQLKERYQQQERSFKSLFRALWRRPNELIFDDTDRLEYNRAQRLVSEAREIMAKLYRKLAAKVVVDEWSRDA